jgi:superfamily II DNA/RNA helicase
MTLPAEAEEYIHRIGRVGRAEARGLAISIVGTEKEKVSASGRRRRVLHRAPACAYRHAPDGAPGTRPGLVPPVQSQGPRPRLHKVRRARLPWVVS